MTQNSKLKIQNLGQALIVIVLLFLVFLLPFFGMRNFSPASDEISHLPSGYSYLKTGEIKLNPQHPPLIKMLAAFPLLFLDIKFNADDLKDPKISEWQFGRNFLSENGVDRVLFWGRIPIILLSVLLGWYIFKWGKELFGYKAGVVGLFIYALMPNMIAHSQLVTTDLGLAAFSFIAVYYFWKFLTCEVTNLQRPIGNEPTARPMEPLRARLRKSNLILTGVFLGLALGSKFSAIFLLPVFPILLLIYFKNKPGTGLQKLNSLLKVIVPVFILAFLTLWVLYFFPSDPAFYYKGLKTVYADNNPDFQYYLNGNFKEGGWWYYFIWAFIIKTPIPFLIALFAAFACWRKNKLNFLDNAFILLPAALFLFIASWKAHNIGVRYVLIIYPFLILYASGYLSQFLNLKFKILNSNNKITAILILLLGGWYIFSAIKVYPNHLSYFNELIGGPNNGYKHLDDSNIDWGQDLKRLAKYQESRPDLQVVYTWDAFTGASKMYNIKNVFPLNLKDQWWANPKGKYAINTHALIRLQLASRKYENEKLNWLKIYKPVDKMGQSFFIYEF